MQDRPYHLCLHVIEAAEPHFDWFSLEVFGVCFVLVMLNSETVSLIGICK